MLYVFCTYSHGGNQKHIHVSQFSGNTEEGMRAGFIITVPAKDTQAEQQIADTLRAGGAQVTLEG